MTGNADDEHLDDYERWARERLTPVLGPFRIIDRPGGPPGLHDFEVDLPDNLVAALEVTSEVDSERLGQAASAEDHLSLLTLSGSKSLWLVGLAAGARASTLKQHLLQLLTDLEAQGRRKAFNSGDYRDPYVQRLGELGIESVYALRPKPGHEGSVMVRPGTSPRTTTTARSRSLLHQATHRPQNRTRGPSSGPTSPARSCRGRVHPAPWSRFSGPRTLPAPQAARR